MEILYNQSISIPLLKTINEYKNVQVEGAYVCGLFAVFAQ